MELKSEGGFSKGVSREMIKPGGQVRMVFQNSRVESGRVSVRNITRRVRTFFQLSQVGSSLTRSPEPDPTRPDPTRPARTDLTREKRCFF